MKCKLLQALLVLTFIYECVAPPVTKNKEHPNEETDTDGLENYMEYHRYLREVVNALESDPEFKKKLEKASEDDIRSGQIAHELEFVNHHVRTRLDEIKRTELARLRELMARKINLVDSDGIDDPTHHHVDHANPHTFEIDDLKKLIAKTTEDLAEADRKRRDEFKQYEMQKEFEKQDKLNHTAGDEKDKLEKEYKEMDEKHKKHEKLHEPGHKQQLEEVWEEQDHMQQDFDPKTFFMLHDLDSNGLWDEVEVKALFIKELDKMYSAGAPEDDMKERAEEMERMRESVFREVDTNKDGFIDYNEFIAQTKRGDFQQDNGWQGLDEQKPYTDEELEEYIRQHQAQQAYYQQHMPPQGMPQHPGQMPPPGMAYPGQMPPPGMAHPGQMPQQMQQHPGQIPQQMQQHPGQMNQPHMANQAQMNQHHQGQVPPGQYHPQYNNQMPPGGGYQQNVGYGQGGPPQMQHVQQQGQMAQVRQNVPAHNPNQQGNMPNNLNTNEVYPNVGQQHPIEGQQNQANQANAIPQAQANVQPQQPSSDNQPSQVNYQQQQQANEISHNIDNNVNKDVQH